MSEEGRMTEPTLSVSEAMDLYCRVAMHNAGGRLREAICAQLDGDHATARVHLDEAEEYLRQAHKLCYATPPPPKPQQPRLV